MTYVLLLLATVRVTRLISSDHLTFPVRIKLAARKPDGMFSYWLFCWWCSSVVAGGVVWGGWWAAQYFGNGVVEGIVLAIVGALAGSMVAGWLGIAEQLLDPILNPDDEGADDDGDQ